MNKIVLEHFPASKLPVELRAGIAEGASVRVTVEEERRPLDREAFARQLAAVRENLTDRITTEDAVARIRALRDEWDD